MRAFRRTAIATAAAGLFTSAAAAQENRPLALAPQAAPEPITYSVVYTGRLFGYFRYPAEQNDSMTSCENVERGLDAAGHLLIDEADALTAPGVQIRAALGDTFAPFLLARVMKDKEVYVGKDLMVYDDLANKWIRTVAQQLPFEARTLAGVAKLPFDNVACFLRLAHFDALVPGKHDFYFGAERLRALSTLLATPRSADTRFTPVQMLAANLSLVTKDRDRKPVPEANIQRAGYTTTPIKLPGHTTSARAVLPAAVLPWMRRVRVKDAIRVKAQQAGKELKAYDVEDLLEHARFDNRELGKVAELKTGVSVVVTDLNGAAYEVTPTVGAAKICAADDHNPTIVELSSCKRLRPALPTDSRLSLTWPYHIVKSDDDPSTGDVTEEFAVEPGNHAICFYPDADATGTPFCTPFTVQAPLFESAAPAEQPPAGCSPPANGRRVPYLLKGDGHRCVAVFGVVDPSLREYVGSLNDTWLSKTVEQNRVVDHESIQTDLTVTDPVEALTQLLQFCEADAACRGARRVLLAQMPRAKAGQVAARFKPGTFDLVIAQTDTDRATGNLSVTKRVAFDEGDVDSIAEPSTLVPGQNFSNNDSRTLHLRVQRATITVTPSRGAVDVAIANEVRGADHRPVDVAISHLPSPLPTGGTSQTLFEWIGKSSFASALKTLTPTSPRAAKVDVLAGLALKTMRDACNSDVAIMQRRDVFLAPEFEVPMLSEPALRLVFDAIFWKGDFITCRTVTGDTLIKIMQRSVEIDSAESNSVFADQEFGRSVIAAGIKKDGTDYVISGLLVNAKKLYALATTDFLSEGDTGYAVLQTAEPKPDRITRLGAIDRLSGLIFKRVAGRTLQEPDTQLPSPDYLDASNRQPADTTSLAWHTASWNWVKSTVVPKKSDNGASPLDQRTQQRPIWALALEKFTLSAKRYEHAHGEQELTDFFAGTGNNALTTPETNSIETHLQFRARRSQTWGDLYDLTELNEDHAHTRNAKGAGETVSSKTNTLANEGGVLLNLFPPRRNPSSYKLLVALRYETERARPTQNITLVDNTVVQGATDRSYSVSAKSGVRREFKDGSYEGGALIGRRHRPVVYRYFGTFTNTSDQFVDCEVTATRTLAKCLEPFKFVTFDRIDTSPDDKFQLGLFASFRLHIPLGLAGLKFFTDNTAEQYKDHDDDLTTDTDYSVRAKQQIEVPVFGNFTLAPAVEWFWYRNKGDELQRHSFRSTSYTVEAKYTFDWRSGLSWKKVLRYPNPSEEK